MQTLKHTFVILQFIGMWRPVHWLPGWKTRLYDSYTSLMMFILVTVIISELIELVNSFGDLSALANNSVLLLTMIADCGKGINILKKRSDIIELTDMLQRNPCDPESEEEFAIQRKFDRLVRSNTMWYTALVGIAVLGLTLRSFTDDIPRRALPYNSWLPFECHESLLGYTIAYSHQIVSVMAGATISAAFDTLLPGLMLQTCAQLNILKCRFNSMSRIANANSRDIRHGDDSNLPLANSESELLTQCATKSNDLFGVMVFVQYTISTVVLCVSVFEISKTKLFDREFLALFLYIICMSVQIFIYCYYGCEVTLESLAVGDAVYDTDWASFSINTKRTLLMIMVRTLRPIQFTTGHIITLNLDYFNNLLKLSYSAYNVLQQSS